MPRPRHRHAAVSTRLPVFLCAKVPAPLIILAVIVAANRQYPFAIWARRTAAGVLVSLWRIRGPHYD